MQPIRLHIIDVRTFPLERALQSLWPQRKRKALRYLRETDRRRSAAAGILMKYAAGISEESQLRYNRFGKPLPIGKRGGFNLSHGGNYIVMASWDGEIGVDIEQIRPWERAVAEKCFARQELEWLDSEKSDENFYRLWTAKESIMKAAGLGFSLPPESFSLIPETGGKPGETCTVRGVCRHLYRFSLEDHAVCAACPKGGLKIETEIVEERSWAL